MADWADDVAKDATSVHGMAIRTVVAAALRQARLDALEEAGRIAVDFTGAMHAAHDLRTGIFPKRSQLGEAIAAAIRSLKEKQP